MKRLLFLMLLFWQSFLFAQNNHWQFNFDGKIDGEAFDVITSPIDGKVYFSGGFLSADGNTDLKNMARWNSANAEWEQVPGINSSHSNFIRCMALDGDGNIYVGGDFNSIGGISAGKVAKFDVANGTWHSLKDPYFNEETQLRGPDAGGVYAIAVIDQYVYIGGYTFNHVDTSYRYIRRFNTQTQTWEKVGRGFNAKVSALAVDDAGNLYAGGSFTKSGDDAINYIAKWDGTKWNALGTGMNDAVYALKWSGGKLYAGGIFTQAGGVASKAVAAWDGTQWQTLNGGVERASGTSTVQSIDADSDGKVYIAGYFSNRMSDNAVVNNVAVWEGSDWSSLGDGLGASSTQGVNAVWADGKDVYFTGVFADPVGNPNVKLGQALWNDTKDFTADLIPQAFVFTAISGTTYTSPIEFRVKFSEPITDFLQSEIEVTNGTVTYFTPVISGKEWVVRVTPAQSGSVSMKIPASVAKDANNNLNTESNSVSVFYSNVSPEDDPNWYFDFNGGIEGEVFGVMKSTFDDKYYFCGGFLSVDGNTDMKNIVRWNPESNIWEQLPGIDYTHSNFIRCMVEDGNGNIYVGGDFSSIGGIDAGRVACFNMETGKWSALKDETFFDQDQIRGPNSGGVYSIALLNNYIYIGGYTFNSSDPAYRYLRRFNLTTRKWEAVGAGITDDPDVDDDIAKVSALETDAQGNLYVGGVFAKAGGQNANGLAKWNGTSWSEIGSGTNGSILDILFVNNKLYVSGTFTKTGDGVRSQYVAAWNGSAWENMEMGFEGFGVYGLAHDVSGNIYAGGYFTHNFNTDAPLNNVAVFKDNMWQPLGLGIGQSSTQGVNAMCSDENNIMFAGYFSPPTGTTSKINHAIYNASANFNADKIPDCYILYTAKNPTDANPIEINIQFSEQVTGFEKEDILVSNGTISYFNQLRTNLRWVARITPTSEGDITVNIAQGVAVDANNNQNNAAQPLAITYSQNLPNPDKNWFVEFNGTIEGEIFDILKSPADSMVYFSGGFLSVNGNTDRKNIVRYQVAENMWQGLPGIDYTHSNFIRCMAADNEGNIFVGGDFSSIGGIPAGKVARFNVKTGTWHSLIDKSFKDADQMRGPATGGVYAIHLHQNYLYIGGYVFNNSDRDFLYLRRFDLNTNKWESIGGGVYGENGAKISAITTDDAGNLYVGGIIDTAGTTLVSGIAMWDGSQWHNLASGVDGTVGALEYHNGKLYVGGDFTRVGPNIFSKGIAAWDGQQWLAMGKGVNGLVQDIALDADGKIYIGGFFTTRYSDDAFLNSAAFFDGTDWVALSSGISASSTQGANAVMADGKNIYFGGAFSKPSELNNKVTQAFWNENIDFDQDVNPYCGLNVEFADTTSSTEIELFIQFSELISGLEPSDFSTENCMIDNIVQQIDELQYKASVYPLNKGKVSITLKKDAVTDINNHTNPESRTLSFYFNEQYGMEDKQWFLDFDGIIEGEVFDIQKSSADNKVYFSGGFLSVDGNTDMKNLVRYNPADNTWEQVPGIDYTHTNFIRCMTQDADGNLYVGGDFSSIGGVSVGRVAKFNVQAGTWHALEDPNFFETTQTKGPNSGGVYDLTISGDYLYIGGYTFNSTDTTLRYIRRFNLSTNTWEAVGKGVNAKVSALVSDGNGNIYAGGVFDKAGTTPAYSVAKWDGTNWTALGTGVDGLGLSVNGLAYSAGLLYIAGDFMKVDGKVSQGVAKWDGSQWHAMGEGIDRTSGSFTVQDVAVSSDNKVYIAGFFDLRFSDDKRTKGAAVFDGTDWQPLGFGLGESSTQGVNTVYADGMDVYFGGAFAKNGHLQNHAIWKPGQTFITSVAPTVRLFSNQTSTSEGAFTITVVFDQAVTGLDASDFTVSNATLSNLQNISGNRVYTVDVSATQNGEISIQLPANKVTNAATLSNTESNLLQIQVAMDMTAPIAEIVADKAYTNTSEVMFTLHFSETLVEFETSALVASNLTNIQWQNLNDSTYSISATVVTEGIAKLQLAGVSYKDKAGNPGEVDAADSVIYDKTLPQIIITANIGNADTSQVQAHTFTFEGNETVIGFEANDIEVTNGSISAFTQIEANKKYTAQISATNMGLVVVKVKGQSVEDFTGNMNIESNSYSFHYIPSTLVPSLQTLGISVYPVPASHMLHIDIPIELNYVKAKILSVNGIVVRQLQLGGGNSKIDISELSPGLYYLWIEHQNKRYQQQILKQ